MTHPPAPASTPPPISTVPTPASSLRRNPLLLGALALWLLRAAYAPFANLFPEEAYYWNYARHLDFGYLDHPPLVAWLIRAGCAVFGDTEAGVRVFALACSLASSFFAFRLAAFLYGRRAGAVAALLTQLLPFFFVAGWMMTPDAPLTACWAAALFYLARALLADDEKAWPGVGLALGVGLLSKYTAALLGPAALLFLAFDPSARRWLRRPAPYAAAALAALLFSPVIAWNARHHWASFAFQSAGRMQEAAYFAPHELLGAILLVLTPPGAWLAARALLGRKQSPAQEPTAPDPRRALLFARVFTGVPLAVFALFSLTHHVKLNWTGPLWLAVVPLLAARLANPPLRPSSFVIRHLPAAVSQTRLSFLFALALAFAYTALLQYLSFGLPGVPYSPHIAQLPVGWRELGRALEQQADALRRAHPAAPVRVVGMDRDFLASEAAFYQSDPRRGARETTGSHLFGRISLMYAYWFPAHEQNGATLLLVSFVRGELDKNRVRQRFDSLEPTETRTLRLRGRPVCEYYTRVGYGYQAGL